MSEIITPLGGKVSVFPVAFLSSMVAREVPDGSVVLTLRINDPDDARHAEIILSPENCDALANALMTRGVW